MSLRFAASQKFIMPVVVAALLAACSHERVFSAPPIDSLAAKELPAMIEEPRLLDVPTYDGTGQAVHPDVVEFPKDWHGSRYWVTMTPYARSDYRVENPSILVSEDGTALAEPGGHPNPIIPRPSGSKDYNSDPELLYEPESDQLVLIYRVVQGTKNVIRMVTSRDGATWSPEKTLLVEPSHAAVSPTVTPATPDRMPRMWYVDAGKHGCGTKDTRVMTRGAIFPEKRLSALTWSDARPTDLVQPGYVIWHMKVRYVASRKEYWALYAAFPKNQSRGCDIDDLFFARSKDGFHWQTFTSPVISHTEYSWSGMAVYRSTFLYDSTSNELRVWVSARSASNTWSMAYTRFRYDRLLDELSESPGLRSRYRHPRAPEGQPPEPAMAGPGGTHPAIAPDDAP